MKTDVRTHQRQRTTEQANRVDWPGGPQPRGARRNQATRPVQSKPREGGTRPNPGERKRSPGADPSDDPSTRKRDEWKASTRIEGDSKEPSASMATRENTQERIGTKSNRTQPGNNPAGRTSAAPRPITLERQRLQRKRQGRNGRQAPKPPHQLPIREEGTKPETKQKERPKANVHSVSGAKTNVNIREAAVPEETRQAQDEKNRRAAEAATA